MTPNTQNDVRNCLLAALPEADFALLQPRLQLVDLHQGHVLHRVNEAIGQVYFPEAGWVSMLMRLSSGASAEVGVIGRDGVVGLSTALGASDRSILEALVQSSGAAWRLEVRALRQVFEDSWAFRQLLLRYSAALQTQVSVTAACNGHHAIEQRLARWLLMSRDRCDGDEFAMTHEFLAAMLGVHRSGVSQAAAAMQQAGLIRYEYGRLTVVNRSGLEATACECYGIARGEHRRLLDWP